MVRWLVISGILLRILSFTARACGFAGSRQPLSLFCGNGGLSCLSSCFDSAGLQEEKKHLCVPGNTVLPVPCSALYEILLGYEGKYQIQDVGVVRYNHP